MDSRWTEAVGNVHSGDVNHIRNSSSVPGAYSGSSPTGIECHHDEIVMLVLNLVVNRYGGRFIKTKAKKEFTLERGIEYEIQQEKFEDEFRTIVKCKHTIDP